jgi:hypothetical protein
MSDSKIKPADKQEDGLLSSIIPVVVSAIVAIGCSVAFDKFLRDDVSPMPVASPILVLSLDEWVKQIPENASAEQMEQVFFKARQAAQAAARAGYVVIDESKVVASPEQARLTPGMFEQAGAVAP